MAKTLFLRPPPKAEVDRFARSVEVQGPAAAGKDLDSFLDRERDYAEQSGDGYFLVRTFNRLANAAMRHAPEWGLGLVEEALGWESRNPHNWVVKARCLEAAQKDNEAIETSWAARLRLPQFPYIRTELGRMLRAGGDWETSEAVYQEATTDFQDVAAAATGLAEVLAERGQLNEAIETYRQVGGRWKTDAHARSGLAKLLLQRRQPGDLDEAERVLRESMELLPNDAFFRTTLAELLKDQERHDEAAEVALEAMEQSSDDPVCRTIPGEIRFSQGLKQGGNEALKDEARKWFEEAADLGDRHARKRLATLEQRWQRILGRGGTRFEAPSLKDRDLFRRIMKFETTESRCSPAQRLGRALLAQGQAVRESDPARKAELFERAKRSLSLPDQEADGDRPAFIEARGFLLLAEGRAKDAAAYFKEPMDRYGREGWVGMQLGYAEARLRMGAAVSASAWRQLSALGPDGAVTSLVARGVHWLSCEGDDELRSALLELYPQAAQAPHPDDETRRPSSLLPGWVNERWFKPAGIAQPTDLQDAAKLAGLRKLVTASAHELQQPFESVQLALAA